MKFQANPSRLMKRHHLLFQKFGWNLSATDLLETRSNEITFHDASFQSLTFFLSLHTTENERSENKAKNKNKNSLRLADNR